MSRLTKGLKKTGIFAAKLVGTTVLTATGLVSAAAEKVISVTGVEPLQDAAHGAMSASFNGLRQMWGAEPTEFDRVDGEAERARLLKQREELRKKAEKKIDQYEQEHPNMTPEQREKISHIRTSIGQQRTSDRDSFGEKDLRSIYISSPKVPAQIGSTMQGGWNRFVLNIKQL